MAVQGLVRLRKHQIGRQSAIGTPVAAKRAYPFKGVPSVDLQWTDPDVDSGSIDPVAAPYRAGEDLTAPLTAPSLYYNDIPLIMCGFFGGGDTPATVDTDARQWTTLPGSATVDALDLFTYEFGDDVTSDWYQLSDGLLESFEITGPEGLGALSATMGWRFGHVASSGSTDMPDSPTVPTGSLNVDVAGVPVYLKDMGIYIATTYADLATSQVTDALHTFTMRGNQEYDLKRYANGDNSFDIDDYGRGARSLQIEATWAKTADTVGIGSESDAWMSDEAINRWIMLKFASTKLAGATTQVYDWEVRMPVRYYAREETDVGGNTAIVLNAHAFYDADDLTAAFQSIVTNTLANANF